MFVTHITTEDTSLFLQLRYLTLEHLPKLLSIQNSLIIDGVEIILEAKPDFHMPILGEQVYKTLFYQVI